MKLNSTRSLCALCAGATFVPSVGLNAQERRPNILFFLVDDMGWQDCSLPFASSPTKWNKMFHTPNLERLARRGVKFTNAYASSVSSPSRCSLLTGSHAARHRVTNWTLHRDKTTDVPTPGIEPPEWNCNGISPLSGVPRTYTATMLPKLLQEAGYHTIHCGKAHFGSIGTPGEDPLNLGFDVNIAGHAAGGLLSYLGQKRFGHDATGKPLSPMAVPSLEKYWDKDIFITEALTLEAIHALREAKKTDKPFFLYMSHYAVHVPVDRDMRFYPKYIKVGLSPKEAAYASLVEGMDKSLGDLMDYLEAEGMLEHTLIVFASDNGGLSVSSYWRDGELHMHNAPLRSGKGSMYEGGVRVPMVVSWPNHTPSGVSCSHPIGIEDFFPTLVEASGRGHRLNHLGAQVDGLSLIPLLRNPQRRDWVGRSLFWHFPNCWDAKGPGISYRSSIRDGRWKLIYSYESERAELYDLEQDLSETTDRASSHPRLVTELLHRLTQRLRSVAAQRPIRIVNGRREVCPWPDGSS